MSPDTEVLILEDEEAAEETAGELVAEDEAAAAPSADAARQPVLSKPAQPAPPRSTLAARLLAAEQQVQRVLSEMPPGLADARDYIAAQFWTKPRPEDLQTLIRVASHPAFKGEHREVPLKAISLRFLAETEAEAFWDPSVRNAEELRETAAFLSQLAEVMAIFEARVEPEVNALARATADERDQILRATRVLFPRQETISGPRVLGPKLASLLESGSAGQLASVFPAITDEEASLFAPSSTARRANAPAWTRVCLDAAALRAILEEDVAGWETLAQFPEGTRPDAVTAEVLQNLIHDQLAYRTVSDRLQQVQDQAVREGDKDLSERIVRLRGPLFATFRRLSPILQAHPEARLNTMASVPSSPPEASGGASHGPDQVVSQEIAEILVGAVPTAANLEAVATARQAVAEKKAGRTRRRQMILGTIALCALGAALAVRMMLPPPPPKPIEVTPSDFAGIAPIETTQAAGPLLIARVSGAWNALAEPERIAAVDSVATVATQHGFRTVQIAGPGGDTLATWDAVHLVRLVDPLKVLPGTTRRPHRPPPR